MYIGSVFKIKRKRQYLIVIARRVENTETGEAMYLASPFPEINLDESQAISVDQDQVGKIFHESPSDKQGTKMIASLIKNPKRLWVLPAEVQEIIQAKDNREWIAENSVALESDFTTKTSWLRFAILIPFLLFFLLGLLGFIRMLFEGLPEDPTQVAVMPFVVLLFIYLSYKTYRHLRRNCYNGYSNFYGRMTPAEYLEKIQGERFLYCKAFPSYIISQNFIGLRSRLDGDYLIAQDEIASLQFYVFYTRNSENLREWDTNAAFYIYLKNGQRIKRKMEYLTADKATAAAEQFTRAHCDLEIIYQPYSLQFFKWQKAYQLALKAKYEAGLDSGAGLDSDAK